jgi:hypothetical protein
LLAAFAVLVTDVAGEGLEVATEEPPAGVAVVPVLAPGCVEEEEAEALASMAADASAGAGLFAALCEEPAPPPQAPSMRLRVMPMEEARPG